MVLVVAAQGREAPQTDGKGEEDLGARIHPHLHKGKEEAEQYESHAGLHGRTRACSRSRLAVVVADLFPLLTEWLSPSWAPK